MKRSLVGMAVMLACASERSSDELPFVQASSPNLPSRTVRITPDLKFGPGCVEIRPGETVEWQSEAAGIPVNVTSLGEPSELFSPNFQAGLACDSARPNQICWRHTFHAAGCFDYFDANSGSGGRIARDPYYGTPTVIGQAAEVTRGTVCVSPSGRCPWVCCDTKFDCSSGGEGEFECVSRRCIASGTARPSACVIRDL